VSAPARLSAPFEAVPTWSESGVSCIAGPWRGVIGTAGLTAEQVAFWGDALRTATRSPAWRAELSRQHWADTYLGPESTGEFLARETVQMRAALQALGLLDYPPAS
jgi:putative tricarboxylic transport membrane protein